MHAGRLAADEQRLADLAASWMVAGFVHGVLNTDNMNVSGESFDYGPWRWLPAWNPGFTAAYFDHSGLYAFGRQPEAIHWDLAQLGGGLSLVADGPRLSDILASWSDRFEAALTDALCRRLGVARDSTVAAALLAALATREAAIDRVFFDWRGARDPGVELYPSSTFRALAKALGAPEELVMKEPTADLESLTPLKPDEDAFGVSYEEIDDFLEGKPIPEASAQTIERQWFATMHKRALPQAPA